jgi:hypothetical protein
MQPLLPGIAQVSAAEAAAVAQRFPPSASSQSYKARVRLATQTREVVSLFSFAWAQSKAHVARRSYVMVSLSSHPSMRTSCTCVSPLLRHRHRRCMSRRCTCTPAVCVGAPVTERCVTVVLGAPPPTVVHAPPRPWQLRHAPATWVITACVAAFTSPLPLTRLA